MKKNDYQNLMEHIQPSAGLNDRVLSAARQTAGAQKETTGPKHLAPGKRRPVLRAAVCAACALALVVGSVTLGPIGGGEPGESTTVTADNYWKGMHDHANALLMTETYGCPDPYALTEMEDHAMSVVLDRLGMLDRYIIIRDSVNTDVFMNGASPESLWDPNFVDSLASESSVESADIFATAMKNNFTVGHVVIDAILNGEL